MLIRGDEVLWRLSFLVDLADVVGSLAPKEAAMASARIRDEGR